MRQLKLQRLAWPEGAAAAHAIRHQVFIHEQGVSPADEWDDLDAQALHWLVWVDEAPVATARLLATGKLTRMAVLAEFRGSGLGRQLLKSVLDDARRQKLVQVYVDAQLQAMGFYAQAGFVAEGETFEDAGIPHRCMRLMLAN